MICFPLDYIEYDAQALGAWCGTRTRGVFAADGHYSVKANGNMSVTLNPGLAWLKADTYWGVNAYEENPTVLEIERADGALSRLDAVCIRLDKNENRGFALIKKGAYSPQPPTIVPPTRNLDYDEIYVATIRVRAGATSILQSDITDQRLNESYCGIMRDGVTGIPTQSLYDSWGSWFKDMTAESELKAAAFAAWLEAYKSNSEFEVEQWIANFQSAKNTEFYGWYNPFVASSESEFIAWLQNLKNQLDDNQAGNLQNQCTELDERLSLLEQMTLQNDFSVPIATDDDVITLLTDDFGNALVADWKYKEE